jgi:hypothetical protein
MLFIVFVLTFIGEPRLIFVCAFSFLLSIQEEAFIESSRLSEWAISCKLFIVIESSLIAKLTLSFCPWKKSSNSFSLGKGTLKPIILAF